MSQGQIWSVTPPNGLDMDLKNVLLLFNSPHCSRNILSHKIVSESTRSDVQGPEMKTQVIESSMALPISYNKSLSKYGAPLLLESLDWCTLSLSAHETDVESSCNWVDLELEWCGRVLHLWDQAWDKIGGIFHHRIVL